MMDHEDNYENIYLVHLEAQLGLHGEIACPIKILYNIIV